MARPPIIISNGGLYTALVKGCANAPDDDEVIKRMKVNIHNLNKAARDDEDDRPIIRMIVSSSKKEDPKMLWCLASEPIKDLKVGLKKDADVSDNDAELSG
ncbi:MAG: hypothetical protein V3U16_00125 [Candidatus Neomarinimicrobiota bacterium]